ncbi:unnamed protein product [Chrysoparadoxa australica]
MAMGHNSLSVLDTRAELSAQVQLNIREEQGHPVYVHKSRLVASSAITTVSGSSSEKLRQRGGVDAALGSSGDGLEVMTIEQDSAPMPPNTLDLFGGLVPPPLRQSKKHFSSTLEYVVVAANLIQKIGEDEEEPPRSLRCDASVLVF